MAQPKALPIIVKMRAERIIKAPVKMAHRLDENDANVLKLIMPDDKVRYVNLLEGRELKATEIKVSIVNDDDSSQEINETAKDPGAPVAKNKEVAPKKKATKKTRTKK